MQEQYAPLYHVDPSAISIPKDGVERLFKSDVDNLYYVRKSDGTYALFGNGGGGGESLQITLAIGNETGGNDIRISPTDSLVFINGLFTSTIDTAVLTGNRNIVFPDASGTVALTSDIGGPAWLLDGNTNGVLAYIGTDDAFDFPIYTNATEKARFLTTGQFGLNTLAPTALFHAVALDVNPLNFVTKIEDGAGGHILYINDDASISIGRLISPDNTYTLTAISKAGAGGFLRVLDSTASEYIHIHDNGNIQFFGTSRIGIGMAPNAATKLFISGQGITDATYGLAVTNSVVATYGLLVDDTNSVGIGISTGAPVIDNSAQLDITSITKGFLEPRMTTAQKNAIVAPAVGLQVYDLTLNVPQYYDGVTWNSFFSSSTAQTPGEIAFFDANGQPTGENYFRFDDPLAFGGEGIVVSSTDGTVLPYILLHGDGASLPDTSVIVFADAGLANYYQFSGNGTSLSFQSNTGTAIFFNADGSIGLGTAPSTSAEINISQNVATQLAHINFQDGLDPAVPASGDMWLVAGLMKVNFGLSFEEIGDGIQIAEGANARMGVSTLVAGTVTVANTSVTATSRIYLTGQDVVGTTGELSISAVIPGVSFAITSNSVTDGRSIAWLIIEPS